MKLFEIFQKTNLYWDLADDNYNSGTYVEYIIEVTDQEKIHLVLTKPTSKNIWHIEFTSNYNGSMSAGITNSGHSISIFNAIAECLRHFVRTRNPAGFKFDAFEESRKRLYDILVGKMADELNWKTSIVNGDKNNPDALHSTKRYYTLFK